MPLCLNQVNYLYHLGKVAYYFSHHQMPVRLDLADYAELDHPKTHRFFANLYESERAETDEGAQFLDEWTKKKENLFTLFERYFLKHKMDPDSVKKQDPQAKHFFLDEGCITSEKELTSVRPNVPYRYLN